MILHVAYVLYASELGGKVLGVRVTPYQAKRLCQAHYNHLRGEGEEQMLDWITYSDSESKGWQAATARGESDYYVEEAELELQSRESDVQGMDWKDRMILQKTIENGHLAERIEQQCAVNRPLEERVEQLGMYIDTLLGWSGLKTYTFKDVGGADELWEVRQR